MTVLGQLVRGLLVVVGLGLQVLVGLQMFLPIDFGPAELTAEQRDSYPWIGLGFEIAAGALAIGAVAGAIRRRGRAEVVSYERTAEPPAPPVRSEAAATTETARFPASDAGLDAPGDASSASTLDSWPVAGERPSRAQAIGGSEWEDRPDSGRPRYGEPVQSGGTDVGPSYADAGRTDEGPSWSAADQSTDAGRGVGEWSRRGQGVGEWLQSEQRRVGGWSTGPSAGQPAAQSAGEWPTAQPGQAGQEAQLNQAGQVGQAGQLGQAGQVGQAGQLGQARQAGQAGHQPGQQGGVDWQAHSHVPAEWPAQQAGREWTNPPGQQSGVADWPSQSGQQSVAEWNRSPAQQPSGDTPDPGGEWSSQAGQRGGSAWSTTQPTTPSTTQPAADWPSQSGQQGVAESKRSSAQQPSSETAPTESEWPNPSGQQGGGAVDWPNQPGQQPAISGWSDDAASQETSDLPDEASRSQVGDWFSEPPRPVASDPPTEARPAVEWTTDPARHGLADWPGEWPFDRPGDRPGNRPADKSADQPTDRTTDRTDAPGHQQGAALHDDRTDQRTSGQPGNGPGEAPRS
jgi:hypothetical protein